MNAKDLIDEVVNGKDPVDLIEASNIERKLKRWFDGAANDIRVVNPYLGWFMDFVAFPVDNNKMQSIWISTGPGSTIGKDKAKVPTDVAKERWEKVVAEFGEEARKILDEAERDIRKLFHRMAASLK